MNQKSLPATITLDLPTCREIIASTGLKAAHGADGRLKSDINAGLQLLIPRLLGTPISSTSEQRDEARNARKATERLLWRLGFAQYNPERGRGTPKWPWPITFIQSDVTELDPAAFEARMTKLVDEVFWLRSEIVALERLLHGEVTRVRAPNFALLGHAYVRDFVFGRFAAYQDIFRRAPAPSRGANSGPEGPTYRFVEAILAAIQKNLVLAGLNDIATLKPLQYSPHVTEGWIRKYRSKTKDHG